MPNFFIAGVPKAGTTSLYYYLCQHPDVYMSPIKEPSYFGSELRPGNFEPALRRSIEQQAQEARAYIQGAMKEGRFGGPVVNWDDYQGLFRYANGQTAIGEASVSYLWSKTAAANIAATIPHAKIVLILRNPAERAFSQYLQAVSGGRVRRSFRAEIRRDMRRQRVLFGLLNPLLEFGLYSEQLRRYIDLFPPQQIRVYLYEEYRSDALSVLRDLFQFLNIDDEFVPDVSKASLEPNVPRFVGAAYFLRRWGLWRRFKEWGGDAPQRAIRNAGLLPRGAIKMNPRDRAKWQDYYRADIEQLAVLIDRDLSGWLRPSF